MRRPFIPEVIQTSAMDCGPACLKALLEAFGVRASYGRLREACFTGLDGTSIDQIEDIALRLGLDAEQIMLPIDHLLLAEAAALPALIVVSLPMDVTHFVVLWRKCGPWVQVMDPAVGRQWRACTDFLSQVYKHSQNISSRDWREWAGSRAFLDPLDVRMRALGISNKTRRSMIASACEDTTAARLSTLDAAVRFGESLATQRVIGRGTRMFRFVETIIKRPQTIPERFWSARVDPVDDTRVNIHGAVLMRVTHARSPSDVDLRRLPVEFADALSERSPSLIRVFTQSLQGDVAFYVALAAALAVATFGVSLEVVLLRGLFDLPRFLSGLQRAVAIAVITMFFAAVTLLEVGLTQATFQAGRRFEGLTRLRFLRKIPRLADTYFRSRLMSDMAERVHAAHRLRDFPSFVLALARAAFGLAFTVGALAFLYPESWMPAFATAAIAVAVPLLFRPWLTERDLGARTHSAALSRFFLDALVISANGSKSHADSSGWKRSCNVRR